MTAIPNILESANKGSRELDAAVTLYIEQQQYPGVRVRQLDEGDDDVSRSGGSRRKCLIENGGTDDWAILHGGDWGATFPVPYYTTSIDVARKLVPEYFDIILQTRYNGVLGAHAMLFAPSHPGSSDIKLWSEAHLCTKENDPEDDLPLALALCMAALIALSKLKKATQ